MDKQIAAETFRPDTIRVRVSPQDNLIGDEIAAVWCSEDWTYYPYSSVHFDDFMFGPYVEYKVMSYGVWRSEEAGEDG